MVAALKSKHIDSFRNGDKVRLIRDLPHSICPLVAGDSGIVIDDGAQLGVIFERYGDREAFYVRKVDGKDRQILDFCIPAAVSAVDILLQMHEINVTPDHVAAWEDVEAAVVLYLEKRLECQQAKDAFLNFDRNNKRPQYPRKIADWRELLVYNKLRDQWVADRVQFEEASTVAGGAYRATECNLAELLPIRDCWFRFGNIAIRRINETDVQTGSWSEVD